MRSSVIEAQDQLLSGSRGLGIRVLAIVEANNVNGTAKAVLEFGREALRTAVGVDLTVATFGRLGIDNSAFVDAVREAGLPLVNIQERKRFDPGVILRLRAAVKLHAPDIIWTNAVKSHFLVRMAGLDRAARWVAFHHGYTRTDLRTRAYNQLDRWSLREADMLITVCLPFAAQIVRRGVAKELVRVLHLPIRPEAHAAPAPVFTITRTPPVILSVGRLSREKGHADLLRAAVRIREWGQAFNIILVGEGAERAALQRLAKQLDLGETVLFAGQQPDTAPFYAAAAMLVLCSESEGCPNVLLEAIQAGVPVIATKVGGIPELVTDEKHALLLKPGDVEGLARAIKRLLSQPELAVRLAGSARELLFRHTPLAYYLGLTKIFKEVLA